MNWYPADQYDNYYTDRLEVSTPEPVKVDGWPGDLFRYSADDFAVMLRPRDGVFVELRAQGDWTRDAFDRVLADVVRVDVRTWLAALPAKIVTPERVDAAGGQGARRRAAAAGVRPSPRSTSLGANDSVSVRRRR